MTIVGWESKYREILKDFGYSRKKDGQSCKLLDSLLPKKTKIKKFRKFRENFIIFQKNQKISKISKMPQNDEFAQK